MSKLKRQRDENNVFIPSKKIVGDTCSNSMIIKNVIKDRNGKVVCVYV